MGLCSSDQNTKQALAEDKARSIATDRQLQLSQREDSLVNKLLLLGAGESGKSTLFKQMQTIYGKGFSDAERKNFVHIVHANVVYAMQVLCRQGLPIDTFLSSH